MLGQMTTNEEVFQILLENYLDLLIINNNPEDINLCGELAKLISFNGIGRDAKSAIMSVAFDAIELIHNISYNRLMSITLKALHYIKNTQNKQEKAYFKMLAEEYNV